MNETLGDLRRLEQSMTPGLLVKYAKLTHVYLHAICWNATSCSRLLNLPAYDLLTMYAQGSILRMFDWLLINN